MGQEPRACPNIPHLFRRPLTLSFCCRQIPLVTGDDGLPDPGPKGTPVFKPHCPIAKDCSHMGDGGQGGSRLEIVDYLRIPAGLKPGQYVLGWRWGG